VRFDRENGEQYNFATPKRHVRYLCGNTSYNVYIDRQNQSRFGLGASQTIHVCQSFLLSGRNVRWPRRMLPLVGHGEYADGTDRQTDGRNEGAPDLCVTLSAMDAASVIQRKNV